MSDVRAHRRWTSWWTVDGSSRRRLLSFTGGCCRSQEGGPAACRSHSSFTGGSSTSTRARQRPGSAGRRTVDPSASDLIVGRGYWRAQRQALNGSDRLPHHRDHHPHDDDGPRHRGPRQVCMSRGCRPHVQRSRGDLRCPAQARSRGRARGRVPCAGQFAGVRFTFGDTTRT